MSIKSGAALCGQLQHTACPNHVALTFGSEEAVNVEWPQSGLTTLIGGCGWSSELRTRSKDILGMDVKAERAAGKAGQ
jgi:hypothetical protein